MAMAVVVLRISVFILFLYGLHDVPVVRPHHPCLHEREREN